MRAGGHIRERDGALALEGFIGDRLVAANIAAVNNSIHIFTQVHVHVHTCMYTMYMYMYYSMCMCIYMYMHVCIQCTCTCIIVCVCVYTCIHVQYDGPCFASLYL